MDGHAFSEKATLLVVDDMSDNLALMSGLFKNDYKVKVANNGENALKIAKSGSPPDLILLDIMMPGMDGFEVCRQLKRAPRTRNIPVIFLTAKIEGEDEKKGLELGAIDYITKPISPPIVMARVRNHLALKAVADFLRDRNDWDSAEQLSDTLNGVSGNVGVSGLQQFVEKLEVAVNLRSSLDGGINHPDELSTQLDNLIAKLGQNRPAEQGKPSITVDREKLKLVCDKLEILLADEELEKMDLLDAGAAHHPRSAT